MAGNLRQRLRRIRDMAAEAGPAGGSRPAVDGRQAVNDRLDGESRPASSSDGAPARPSPTPSIGAPPGLGPGWSLAAEGVYASERLFPFPSEDVPVPGYALSRSVGSEAVKASDCAFLDFETTGLSGGAGTVAFLAGIGRLVSGGLAVTLYFLSDYPYEPAFLELVEGCLASREAVVTYNGSSFDMPLYRTRRAMNGLCATRARRHLDALHAARRLWRGPLGECSLGAVERGVLGVEREGDLPGSMIPEVWFDYLRRGATGLTEGLDRVFGHNRRDILSLALVFDRVALAVSGDDIPEGVDLVGLAALRARIGDGRAEPLLARALEGGDDRAARPLASLYARTGRRAERLALVPRFPDDPRGLYSKSVYAERVDRDVARAIELAERALRGSGAGTGLRAAAERRVARLRRG